MFCWCSWYETHYTREATVIDVTDDIITVVDRCDYTWSFEGDGFNRFLETWGQGQDFNVRLGVTWNFKSGKQFRTKSVEQGADTSRM